MLSDKMTCEKIKGDYRPLDILVGFRVHLKRVLAQITEEQLADALRMQAKDVREFEKGLKPISAPVLYHISVLLKVPLATFFKSFSDVFDVEMEFVRADDLIDEPDVLGSRQINVDNEIVELVHAYQDIELDQSRCRMLELMKALANEKSP